MHAGRDFAAPRGAAFPLPGYSQWLCDYPARFRELYPPFSVLYFRGQPVSAKLAGGRFIYARSGVTLFRLSRFAIAIADIIK